MFQGNTCDNKIAELGIKVFQSLDGDGIKIGLTKLNFTSCFDFILHIHIFQIYYLIPSTNSVQ